MADLKRTAHQLAEADEYLVQLDDVLDKAKRLVLVVRHLFDSISDAVLEVEEVLDR